MNLLMKLSPSKENNPACFSDYPAPSLPVLPEMLSPLLSLVVSTLQSSLPDILRCKQSGLHHTQVRTLSLIRAFAALQTVICPWAWGKEELFLSLVLTATLIKAQWWLKAQD